LRWKLMQVSGILVHLFLVIATSISFVYDLGKTTTSQPVQWDYHVHSTAILFSPCRFALVDGYTRGGRRPASFDLAVHSLPVASFVVGSLGLAINVAFFVILQQRETNRITLTEGEQHWRKQVLTSFACLANLPMGGAGVGLAFTLGIKAADLKALAAPLIWAVDQACVCPPSHSLAPRALTRPYGT
ncbi:hypothetical protein C8A05DRAFT_14323, partial [Staphylotrichum tortipilum]